MSDRPPACIASPITVPLNALASFGRRMMMRVVYGAPLAVPDTKYSSVMYGKSSTFAAVGTMLTGGFGYTIPGDVIGPATVGIGGVDISAAASRNAFIVSSLFFWSVRAPGPESRACV